LQAPEQNLGQIDRYPLRHLGGAGVLYADGKHLNDVYKRFSSQK